MAVPPGLGCRQAGGQAAREQRVSEGRKEGRKEREREGGKEGRKEGSSGLTTFTLCVCVCAERATVRGGVRCTAHESHPP